MAKSDKKLKGLIAELENACLEMTFLLNDIHKTTEVLSSQEVIEAIKAEKGEKGLEYLTIFLSDTANCVADATKNLAFIVKWIQCLKGESNACSPEFLNEVRMAALALTTAFREKQFKHPYYDFKNIHRYITPFNFASSLNTTISLYAMEHPSPELAEAVSILSTKPKDLIEKYEKLAEKILFYVSLIINKYVLGKIENYLNQSFAKEAENISEEEIPEELFEEE